jgi:hypothetical protein
MMLLLLMMMMLQGRRAKSSRKRESCGENATTYCSALDIFFFVLVHILHVGGMGRNLERIMCNACLASQSILCPCAMCHTKLREAFKHDVQERIWRTCNGKHAPSLRRLCLLRCKGDMRPSLHCIQSMHACIFFASTCQAALSSLQSKEKKEGRGRSGERRRRRRRRIYRRQIKASKHGCISHIRKCIQNALHSHQSFM